MLFWQLSMLVNSPCARSEKRPRNEVSFRVPGNICFFALMGRKHDAEVEFTCCHSQKSAKVGFSKGFLSDLIGPDRVVDICRGQPARRRWQDDTMVISCKTMHVVVGWWPKLKGVVVPEVSPVTAWHRNMCVVFFWKSWEKSPRFAQLGGTASTTPWRKLPRTDVAKDCFCHCRDANGKLVDFTEASWQTSKKAAEVRQDDMYDNLASRFDEGRFGSYHRPFYQKHTNKSLLVSRHSVKAWS